MTTALTETTPTTVPTEELKAYAAPLLNSLMQDSETGRYTLGELPTVTQELKERARIIKIRTEKHLAPAEKTVILGHVDLMLRHYYVDGKLSAAIMEGMWLQWGKVLENYPGWAIEQAVTEYLANDDKGRKPVPGQIRALCNKAISKYRALIVQCDRVEMEKVQPVTPKLTPEERLANIAKVEAIVADTLHKLKFPGSSRNPGECVEG